MKKHIFIILIISVFLILLNVNVFAKTLNINVVPNKEKVEVDEEVTITIDWTDGMQAADFFLKYDNTRFEFVSMDIEDTFYKVDNSQIEIAWFSIDNIDKTSIQATFKALKSGKADFKVEIDGGFADADVIRPDDYTINNSSVKVNGISFGEILPIIIVLVIIILIIIIVKFRKSQEKK